MVLVHAGQRRFTQSLDLARRSSLPGPLAPVGQSSRNSLHIQVLNADWAALAGLTGVSHGVAHTEATRARHLATSGAGAAMEQRGVAHGYAPAPFTG